MTALAEAAMASGDNDGSNRPNLHAPSSVSDTENTDQHSNSAQLCKPAHEWLNWQSLTEPLRFRLCQQMIGNCDQQRNNGARNGVSDSFGYHMLRISREQLKPKWRRRDRDNNGRPLANRAMMLIICDPCGILKNVETC